jgi:hypothetical protein
VSTSGASPSDASPSGASPSDASPSDASPGDASPGGPVLTRWIGPLDTGVTQIAPARCFVLAGLEWQHPRHARIELRARLHTGRWTPWTPASVLGHDSDQGESLAHALVGEPIWTGAAGALELRTDTPVEGLGVHLVLASAVAGTSSAGATAAAALPLAAPDLPAGPGQPPIIAREAWADGLLPRVAPSYGDIRLAFVHHSVNANSYGSAEVPAMLRSIYYFHTHVRGWNDFGYNFAVDAYGRIWEGRAGGIDRPVMGAQAGGYNLESFGAVLLGDFAAVLPTPAARSALAQLVAWKLALHGVPASGRVTVEVDPGSAVYTHFRPGQHVSLPRIAGHRDGCTTDCPGEDMYVRGMPELRSAVGQIIGRQLSLTLEVGPPPGSPYALAPYPIAPGVKVRRATYLDLATVTMTAGRELALHGALRTLAGERRPDARIVLQDLIATREGEGESHVATARTDRGGVWAATLAPRTNMLLRALHAQAPAAVSALIAIGVAPQLTLRVRRASGAIHVDGTVSPPKPHVELIAASPSGRHKVLTHRLVAVDDGSFSAQLALAPGHYAISAQTPADNANIAGESRTIHLRVP